eukprot:1160784-Pelagomonas_calceolata.AAC.13
MIKQPRARVCGGRGAGATLESIAYKNDECLFPDHGQDHGQARRLTLTQKERFQVHTGQSTCPQILPFAGCNKQPMGHVVLPEVREISQKRRTCCRQGSSSMLYPRLSCLSTPKISISTTCRQTAKDVKAEPDTKVMEHRECRATCPTCVGVRVHYHDESFLAVSAALIQMSEEQCQRSTRCSPYLGVGALKHAQVSLAV